MEEQIFKTKINGKKFSISAGKIAKQASGSVVVQYGDTIVLVTVVSSKEPKDNLSFLPLTVEYQEKIYSAGRIPGNYFRREIGRPSEKETLTSRLIDRSIRPLFEKGYSHEVQVIATVLSRDKENEPDILAMVGTSAALEISDIPFAGPIASIRVGRIKGEFIANPTLEQIEQSDIDLVIAGSKTGVTMVEGGADIVSEGEIIDAIFFGHKAMYSIIELQHELKKSLGKEKKKFVPDEIDEELFNKIKKLGKDKIAIIR